MSVSVCPVCQMILPGTAVLADLFPLIVLVRSADTDEVGTQFTPTYTAYRSRL